MALLVSAPAALAQTEEVTGEVLEVYADDFANHRAEHFYVLRDHKTGASYRLRFEGEPRPLKTGDRIRARGRKQQGELVLPANSNSIEPVELASPATAVTGEQRVLVIAVNFLNASVECAPAQIREWMFDGAQSVNGMYQETSLGNLWLTGEVVGPFTIPFNSNSGCDYNAWANAADAAATAAGVNLAGYNRKVYVLPKSNACSWTGLGTVGGHPSRSWIAACDLADVYAHELGHNFGMHHASTDSNNDGITDCEYCDNSDIMGYGGVGLRALNAPHRQQLGWHVDGKIQDITTNGVFMVAPLETFPLDTPFPQTLRVAKPGTSDFYYFSYRRRLGYAANMPATYADRTSVHSYRGNGSFRTHLVRTLPDSGSFTDAASGLTVVQLSHNSDFATLSVSFGCTRAAPTVNVTPSGGTLSFNVTVANNDSASCGSTAFVLSRGVPAGWGATLLPLSMTLAPGQSGVAQLKLTPPAGLASGVYTATVNVADNFHTIHNVSVPVVFTLGASPTLDTEPPTPPSDLSAASRQRRVALKWNRSTDNVRVAHYVVRRDGVFVGQTKRARFADRGLAAGATYSYSVTARDAAGNESLPGIIAATVTAPK